MDYGYEPEQPPDDPVDLFYKSIPILYSCRTPKTLGAPRTWDGDPIKYVQRFIRNLDSAPASSGITRPIGDIVLGTHASSLGGIKIPMYDKQSGWTVYETFVATLAQPINSIKIPDTLIDYKEAVGVNRTVHIVGCNIGKAPKFLTKMKEALGGHVKISAPKHFHGLEVVDGLGVFEWMGYEFSLSKREPVDAALRNPTRKQRQDLLIKAFQDEAKAAYQIQGDKRFRFIDGSQIPEARWKDWIPTDIDAVVGPTVTANLGVAIGNRTTIDVERWYSSVSATHPAGPVTYPDASLVPKSDADRLKAVEDNLRQDSQFNPPYPLNERLGFATLQDFVRGQKWTFTPSGNTLSFVGRRSLYDIVVPIVDPVTSNLLFNFYPFSGASPVPPKLPRSDPRFYETV